jgi:hypothetical protein
MTGWIIAFIFAGIDDALVACIRQLRARLCKEITTTEFLTDRLIETGLGRVDYPGVAAPITDRSGFYSPGRQGGERSGSSPARSDAQPPLTIDPRRLSTEGD